MSLTAVGALWIATVGAAVSINSTSTVAICPTTETPYPAPSAPKPTRTRRISRRPFNVSSLAAFANVFEEKVEGCPRKVICASAVALLQSPTSGPLVPQVLISLKLPTLKIIESTDPEFESFDISILEVLAIYVFPDNVTSQ